MNKKISIILFFFFFLIATLPAFSQEHFMAVGVKVEGTKEGTLSVSVYFNDAVRPESVRGNRVRINGKPLPEKMPFLFNKSRRMIRFSLKNPRGREGGEDMKNNAFSLFISDFRSVGDRMLKPLELTDIRAGDFYKFSRSRLSWQKFSL